MKIVFEDGFKPAMIDTIGSGLAKTLAKMPDELLGDIIEITVTPIGRIGSGARISLLIRDITNDSGRSENEVTLYSGIDIELVTERTLTLIETAHKTRSEGATVAAREYGEAYRKLLKSLKPKVDLSENGRKSCSES